VRRRRSVLVLGRIWVPVLVLASVHCILPLVFP
jgi:hypothetical protein